jgi:hypothetical protein
MKGLKALSIRIYPKNLAIRIFFGSADKQFFKNLIATLDVKETVPIINADTLE